MVKYYKALWFPPFCMNINCFRFHLSRLVDLTKEYITPYCLCLPAQSIQRWTPRCIEAQVGFFFSQSIHIYINQMKYIVSINFLQLFEYGISYIISNNLSYWRSTSYAFDWLVGFMFFYIKFVYIRLLFIYFWIFIPYFHFIRGICLDPTFSFLHF